MNTVNPIREMNLVLDIADYLRYKKGKYSYRNYMLWFFGVYLGLRISDILLRQVRDIRHDNTLYFRDTKTNKENYITIPDEYVKDIRDYIKDMRQHEYLFASRKYIKKKDFRGEVLCIKKPISRQQAYNIISQACYHFGLTNVGTHTMRKTFGYFLYKETNDIVLVQDMLNHTNPSYTKRYIGITQEDKSIARRGISYRRCKR